MPYRVELMFLDKFTQALRNPLGLVKPCFRDNNEELFPAPAAQCIGSPNCSTYNLSNFLEDAITCVMAIRIVHLFKLVNVEHDDREGKPRSFCLGDFFF